MNVNYKGKHAELCRAVETRQNDEAMRLIYAFFRSEENTDSYSIPALTIIRELMEDGDSDELIRLRLRMRGNGDKMFITLSQFVWALNAGGFEDGAEILADKLYAELPKMTRSMQEFADEEGLSQATFMAGMRIREAMRIMTGYCEAADDDDRAAECRKINLDMTRIFLFSRTDIMAEDTFAAAQAAADRDDEEDARKLCEEIIENYAHDIETAAKYDELTPENRAAAKYIVKAMKMLNGLDEDMPCKDKIAVFENI